MPAFLSAIRIIVLGAIGCLALSRAHAAEPAANQSWKVHQTVPAIYPKRLHERGITKGEVLARVSILETGKLADALVIYATETEFADEVLRVLKLWRFDPAIVNGQNFGVVGQIKFRFELGGTIGINVFAGDRLNNFDRSNDPLSYHAVELRQLDRVPTPTHVEEPIYSKAWIDQGIAGTATIEFYIDEKGNVRTPAIMNATHEFLGGSAAAAVAGWKFEPPTRNGKPALVRVEQTFKFQPPPKD